MEGAETVNISDRTCIITGMESAEQQFCFETREESN